jgi:hypothetical protein
MRNSKKVVMLHVMGNYLISCCLIHCNVIGVLDFVSHLVFQKKYLRTLFGPVSIQ